MRRRAPRVVLSGLSRTCDLACGFCLRADAGAGRWSEDAAFEPLQALWRPGTLEVSLAGGEPLGDAVFVSLLERLHRHAPLAPRFTTNGTRVSPALAERLAPLVGEVRLSAYDHTDWEGALRTLTGAGCRVGVNVMVGRKRLGVLPGCMSRAAAAGVCDLAVLRYVGGDDSLQRGPTDFAMLEQAIVAAPLPIRVASVSVPARPTAGPRAVVAISANNDVHTPPNSLRPMLRAYLLVRCIGDAGPGIPLAQSVVEYDGGGTMEGMLGELRVVLLPAVQHLPSKGVIGGYH